ncbi:MAG TPA: HlyD family efflux transporter periplasmic adaptor subunit [Verrucomicrobiae bacterium]|nr:HlyD family efflux transporter periplasmic adaptor subunit [Verrucomicrobiae bacterium]
MQSAPAEVTPNSETPSSPAALPGAPEIRDRARRIRILVSAAAVVILVAAAAFLVSRHRKSLATSSHSRFSSNPPVILRLRGTTEAVQARSLLAPQLEGQQVGTLTVIHLTPAGTRVKKGDLLVEFDRQAQMRDYFDKQAEYQKLVDQVAEEQAKESAARAKDETELKQAEDDLSKAQLESQKAEILSRIDAEKNQETLDEAKATYDQLKETFGLKRAAAQAAIRILEIQRDRTQQTMLHAQANSDLMQIRAPIDGIVVLNTIWKEGTMGEVQEGDQVRPGVSFMQVVNPAAMEVQAFANQQDFPSLHIGQTATVRLDAYPDLTLPAKVEELAPIAESGDFSSRLRQFALVVNIEGTDPKLMPDLSAAVDVNVTPDANSVATRQAMAGGTQ